MCVSFLREIFLGSPWAGARRGLLRAGALQIWGHGELGKTLGTFGAQSQLGGAAFSCCFCTISGSLLISGARKGVARGPSPEHGSARSPSPPLRLAGIRPAR